MGDINKMKEINFSFYELGMIATVGTMMNK
jgi:hypothetical protein